ncbi:protein of unknown function DUF4283 [Macleaya cordata]|uniref:Uncharacterized protein n=1 Tax=Macleaya cordata TaxID=56857 RepID=A0A200R8U3_MACCD|nr:protein of unknown function DUF4283 [Macleaya cordata]
MANQANTTTPKKVSTIIDRKTFSFHIGNHKNKNLIIFTESNRNQRSYGALKNTIAAGIEAVLIEAVKSGIEGKGLWKLNDTPAWCTIQQQSNSRGPYLHMTLSRLDGKGILCTFYIPPGDFCKGWTNLALMLSDMLSITRENPKPNPTPPPNRPRPQPHTRSQQRKPIPSIIYPCDLAATKFTTSKTTGLPKPSVTISQLPVSPTNVTDHSTWNDLYLCISPQIIYPWEEAGKTISKFLNTSATFDLLPIDDFSAYILPSSAELKKTLSSKQRIPFMDFDLTIKKWSPIDLKLNPPENHPHYKIAFFGVPVHFWSSNLINHLAAFCGEITYIAHETKYLEDLSAIRIGVKNLKGLNSIPRWLDLNTHEGQFGVAIQVDFKQPLDPFWNRNRITIYPAGEDEGYGSSGSSKSPLGKRKSDAGPNLIPK